MLNRMPHATGNLKLNLVVVALLVVILFVVSYRISGLLLNPAAPPADTSAAEHHEMSGVAVVNPPHPLQDFTLTSKSGDPISLSNLRGRAVLLFFGYTHCPDVCPTTLADYKRVKQMLGDQADQVAFVFVSVDGKRDTPQQMAAFLDQFDPAFVGMTGDEVTLREIGAEYGLLFSPEHVTVADAPGEHDQHHEHMEQAAEGEEPLDAENYFVQHTSPSFVIDRSGVLRMVDFYGTEPHAIAESLRRVLQDAVQ